MVTRETNYIGQLYFGLSTDDPADIPEWHNGDRILLMDEDKMYVYDEAAVTFHEIPMSGGGGGNNELALMGSGTYVAATAPGTMDLQIPVAVPDGVCKRFAVYVTPASGVACTYAWTREYGLPNDVAAVIPRASTAARQQAGNTKLYSSDTSYANYAMIAFLDHVTNPSIIEVRRYADTFPLPAGTYTWYMWGAIS